MWAWADFREITWAARASSTGWRKPIRCLKLQLQFIFCNRATHYRALLRKMTYEDEAPYASTPPCSELSFETYAHTHAHTHTHTSNTSVSDVCARIWKAKIAAGISQKSSAQFFDVRCLGGSWFVRNRTICACSTMKRKGDCYNFSKARCTSLLHGTCRRELIFEKLSELIQRNCVSCACSTMKRKGGCDTRWLKRGCRRVCAWLRMDMRYDISKYMCVHIHVHVYTYMLYTYIHIHIYTRIYIYVIYIYT